MSGIIALIRFTDLKIPEHLTKRFSLCLCLCLSVSPEVVPSHRTEKNTEQDTEQKVAYRRIVATGNNKNKCRLIL